jgi:hypothetical protein
MSPDLMSKDEVNLALDEEFPHLMTDVYRVDHGLEPTAHYKVMREIYQERAPKYLDTKSVESDRLVLACAREAHDRLMGMPFREVLALSKFVL